MGRWIFTFGTDVYLSDGKITLDETEPESSRAASLGGCYVLVTAETEDAARHLFTAVYGTHWASIYDWDAGREVIARHGLTPLLALPAADPYRPPSGQPAAVEPARPWSPDLTPVSAEDAARIITAGVQSFTLHGVRPPLIGAGTAVALAVARLVTHGHLTAARSSVGTLVLQETKIAERLHGRTAG